MHPCPLQLTLSFSKSRLAETSNLVFLIFLLHMSSQRGRHVEAFECEKASTLRCFSNSIRTGSGSRPDIPHARFILLTLASLGSQAHPRRIGEPTKPCQVGVSQFDAGFKLGKPLGLLALDRFYLAMQLSAPENRLLDTSACSSKLPNQQQTRGVTTCARIIISDSCCYTGMNGRLTSMICSRPERCCRPCH